MLVKDIMITEFATVDQSASLKDAAVGMVKSDHEFLIVTEDDQPSGLITPRRALVACVKTGKPIDSIPSSGFANGFPVTIEPDTPVLFAISHMRRSQVDVLPVQKDLSIVGVVTRSEIVNNVSNMRNEAINNASEGAKWNTTKNV